MNNNINSSFSDEPVELLYARCGPLHSVMRGYSEESLLILLEIWVPLHHILVLPQPHLV